MNFVPNEFPISNGYVCVLTILWNFPHRIDDKLRLVHALIPAQYQALKQSWNSKFKLYAFCNSHFTFQMTILWLLSTSLLVVTMCGGVFQDFTLSTFTIQIHEQNIHIVVWGSFVVSCDSDHQYISELWDNSEKRWRWVGEFIRENFNANFMLAKLHIANQLGLLLCSSDE